LGPHLEVGAAADGLDCRRRGADLASPEGNDQWGQGRGEGRGEGRAVVGRGIAPVRAVLWSPEEDEIDSITGSPPSREHVADSVPHLSSGGTGSRGWTWNGRGSDGSLPSKRPCGFTRGHSAQGMVAQGKGGEPSGMGCNQTSPYGATGLCSPSSWLLHHVFLLPTCHKKKISGDKNEKGYKCMEDYNWQLLLEMNTQNQISLKPIVQVTSGLHL
jgi:hypothetical protein